MIHKKLIITLEQAWLREGMGERFTFHLLNFSIPYVCTVSIQYISASIRHLRSLERGHLNLVTVTAFTEGK